MLTVVCLFLMPSLITQHLSTIIISTNTMHSVIQQSPLNLVTSQKKIDIELIKYSHSQIARTIANKIHSIKNIDDGFIHVSGPYSLFE